MVLGMKILTDLFWTAVIAVIAFLALLFLLGEKVFPAEKALQKPAKRMATPTPDRDAEKGHPYE